MAYNTALALGHTHNNKEVYILLFCVILIYFFFDQELCHNMESMDANSIIQLSHPRDRFTMVIVPTKFDEIIMF